MITNEKAQPNGVVQELIKRAADVVEGLHGEDLPGAMPVRIQKLKTALDRLNSPPVGAGEYGDAYQGAREDLAIWKRRALEAEQKARNQEQIIDHLTLEAQGETRFGEPSLPAAGSTNAPDVLLPALRQYRHNCGGDELIPGYDYDETNRIVAVLTASAPNHGEQVRDALARRCLWLAFCWNDHNFGPAHEEARKEALKHGIDSFEAANEWLAATPSAGSQGGDV